jgi:branched-chain amino acid aminotransferase
MSVTWFNGALIEGAISIDPADRGLTLGDGVFETILVRGSKIIWLDEHLVRMKVAAQELGIEFDEAQIRAGAASVSAENRHEVSALRITLTRGVVTPRALTGHGVLPNLLMTLSEINAAQPASLTLAISTIRRNETAPSSRLKTLSYMDNIAAAREVTARADDALMLNTVGHVASTTIGNLFLLKGSNLITPSLDQGILAGITRGKILSLARGLGLTPLETAVRVDDLFSADAVFRCNSLRLATPVTKVDDRLVGRQSIENISSALLKGMTS